MRTETEDHEDQLAAMLLTEQAYTPATCAHPSAFGVRPFYSELDEYNAPCTNDEGCYHLPSFRTEQGRYDSVIPHEKWRARIVDWCYRVVDRFQYDREVVCVSMNFFDRFLVLKREEKRREELEWGGPSISEDSEDSSKGCVGGAGNAVLDVESYHLYAMTALYLSAKVHGHLPDDEHQQQAQQQQEQQAKEEPQRPRSQRRLISGTVCGEAVVVSPPTPQPRDPPPKKRQPLTLKTFAELSRGQFNKDDIADAEEEMLRVLRWRVNPPTPMAFVSHLIRLFPSSPREVERRDCVSSPARKSRSRRTPRCSFLPRDDAREEREAEGDEAAWARRQRHDLVLHVLHELSRYLTELSVCLPDVYSRHDPSVVSYAAVIASAECMNLDSLDWDARSEFLGRARGLSSRLRQGDEEVEMLRMRMRSMFLEELLAAPEGAGDGHPITIAREAGLLEEGGGRCGASNPGTSASNAGPVTLNSSDLGSCSREGGQSMTDPRLTKGKLLRQESPRAVDEIGNEYGVMAGGAAGGREARGYGRRTTTT